MDLDIGDVLICEELHPAQTHVLADAVGVPGRVVIGLDIKADIPCIVDLHCEILLIVFILCLRGFIQGERAA